MATEENRETLCASCGFRLDERSDLPVEERDPCPDCGSTGRKYRLHLTATISATSSVDATLTNEPETQVIQPAPATARVVALPPGVTVGPSALPVEDLPTDVIAECLQVNVNILERDENGQWPVEVGAFGVVGMLGVGSLDDALLAVAEWIRQLAERWQDRLTETD